MNAKMDESIDRHRKLANYPAAYSDTSGIFGGRPFTYRNGPVWPEFPRYESNPRPYMRELRSVPANHLLVRFPGRWTRIKDEIQSHLIAQKFQWSSIMGLAFGNFGEAEPICELLIIISLVKGHHQFSCVKEMVDHVKNTVLCDHEYKDYNIAVLELPEDSDCRNTCKIAALPDWIDSTGNVTQDKFYAHFTGNPGAQISHLHAPYLAGSLGLYLTDENHDTYALTCCHVAREDFCTSETGSFPEDKIILLGDAKCTQAFEEVHAEILACQRGIRKREWTVEDHKTKYAGDQERIDRVSALANTQIAEHRVSIARLTGMIAEWESRGWKDAQNRVIGHVHHVEPITAGSETITGDEGQEDYSISYTIDIGVIKIYKEAYTNDFIEKNGEHVKIGQFKFHACFASFMTH